MDRETRDIFADALGGVAHEAISKLLRVVRQSPRLSGAQIEGLDRGLLLWQNILDLWPEGSCFEMTARHDERGESQGFALVIQQDSIDFSLSSTMQMDGGVESFTEYSFMFELPGYAEVEGRDTVLDAFADEVTPEYFEHLEIDYQAPCDHSDSATLDN